MADPVSEDLLDALWKIEERARKARKGFEEHLTVNGRTALWDCELTARFARMRAEGAEETHEAV